jgi:peptidoglycan/xylan/chitin deacetylase (PgdA/CDA1 family)
MSAARLASVSVDLDGLEHYRAIHGLGPGGAGDDPVYAHAVPRFCDLFAEVGVRATFFAIGRDLEDPDRAAALRAARDAGHEVANHSYTHPYDLVRRGDDEVEAEVVRGEEAIRAAVGAPCAGFRAPGYNLDERILAACRRLGYRYDSSVLPSYPYYLGKAAVMAGLWLRRRPSRATLGNPKVLFCPTGPYRPRAQDYRSAGGEGLWEIPITLVPILRFPFIGTWICLWSDRTLDLAWTLVRRRSFVNLELHAIELLGLAEDALDPALRVQPDLEVPLAEKRRKIARALARLREDREVMPLAEASEHLGATGA